MEWKASRLQSLILYCPQKCNISPLLGEGGASTTSAIPVHHIHVGEGDDIGSGNGADNDDNSIVFSFSSLYWGRTTKQTKEEILQHRVLCVKIERGPKG